MKLKPILWLIIICLIFFIIWSPQKEEIILEDGIYENCYMFSLKEEQMDVLVDGEKILIPCPVGEEIEKSDQIADIRVEDNRVKKIIWKEGLVEDKVDAVNLEEGWIALKTQGRKNISKKGRLYIKTGEEVHILQKSGSLLTRDKISFYIYEDEICAAVVAGEEDFQNIRVLLHGEIDGIYHEKVVLTGTDEFTVEYKEEKQSGEHDPEAKGSFVKTYKAGEKVEVTNETGAVRVTCPNGRIQMLSLDRSTKNPEYRGDILIDSTDQGLVVRNEVKLEEYLYSVVSSEMPSSYPLEALKAQAICARTYAIYQMKQAYFGEYGAHVDDTVNSQVYNNVAETESTKMAVDNTIGQYLSYEAEPICAYFYSTSCGTTSDVKDVWIGEGESPVYLRGRFQGILSVENDSNGETTEDGEPIPDNPENSIEKQYFSKEEDFLSFILSEQEACFEKEEPWFRWNCELSLSELTSHVEKNLDTWIKTNPTSYQLDSEKNAIGRITKVEVSERSPGGVIKKLVFTGEKGIFTVTGEYQIRKVMCPEKTTIRLQDESTREISMLPSGYFAVTMGDSEDNLTIQGGGYGHGVGLSQNGAGAMAKQEYGYEDILQFYYPETELLELY